MQSAKTILIQRGVGFLGSRLCDRLLAEGHDVLCADNFFTGAKRNIDHLMGRQRFELIRHDVTFPLYVEVDEIYNLACQASRVHYQHDPVQTAKTSVRGRSTCWVWPSASDAASFRRPPRKSTAIQSCIRKRKTIGGTSIQSERARATMQALRRDLIFRLSSPA